MVAEGQHGAFTNSPSILSFFLSFVELSFITCRKPQRNIEMFPPGRHVNGPARAPFFFFFFLACDYSVLCYFLHVCVPWHAGIPHGGAMGARCNPEEGQTKMLHMRREKTWFETMWLLGSLSFTQPDSWQDAFSICLLVALSTRPAVRGFSPPAFMISIQLYAYPPLAVPKLVYGTLFIHSPT